MLNVEIDQSVAVVTIDRPKVLNALNREVFDKLRACFDDLEHDPSVQAVIVTGAGEKAFVAGADIKELAETDPLTAKHLSARGQTMFRRIETFAKPVIAAINGFALGGGCELALACHIRVASDHARIGLPEVGLGLIPGYGGTQRLARLIGKGLATEMVLTADMVGAERAHQMGLVNHVTEPGALLAKCHEIAQKILAKGPVAVQFGLEAVTYGIDLPEEDGERLENNLFGLLMSTEDTREGLAAFLEKRKPEFKGR